VVQHVSSVSITDSRLVVVSVVGDGKHLIILDWKSARVLFEFNYGSCGPVEFVDDYRLLIRAGPTANVPPSLVLMDTGKDRGGFPMQTSFHLPYFFGGLSFVLERGAHKPSPAESLAPFHQDPTQRIVALDIQYPPSHLVFRVGALLELLKDHEGTGIGWDEWKHHMVVPSIDLGNKIIQEVRVSGCRLFSLSSPGYRSSFRMEMYDFSMEGRTKHSSERVSGHTEGVGVVKYLSSTGTRAEIIWKILSDGDAHSGHDSLVFFHWDSLYGRPWDQYIMSIWSF